MRIQNITNSLGVQKQSFGSVIVVNGEQNQHTQSLLFDVADREKLPETQAARRLYEDLESTQKEVALFEGIDSRKPLLILVDDASGKHASKYLKMEAEYNAVRSGLSHKTEKELVRMMPGKIIKAVDSDIRKEIKADRDSFKWVKREHRKNPFFQPRLKPLGPINSREMRLRQSFSQHILWEHSEKTQALYAEFLKKAIPFTISDAKYAVKMGLEKAIQVVRARI